MKLLHTSDWHVGRTIRGRSRAEEHVAVLAEIAGIAAAEAVDLVLVTGDLFDSAAPTPEAERIVYRALLDLEASGATVVVITGNHDNERRLLAVEPLLGRGRIVARSLVAAPADGGVVEVRTAGGEDVQVALVPFLSQRYVVRADELMGGEAADQVLDYANRVERVVAALCSAFRPGAVHVVAAHLFALGGTVMGSERVAHTALGYAVPTHVFPPSAHYVALGHLHRPQSVGLPFIRYAGSPLQLDFGEAGEQKSVALVEATAATPAVVREVPLTAGRRLRVVEGDLGRLTAVAAAAGTGDDHLKVVVKEASRAGLADEVRALFEHAVDVVVEPPAAEGGATPKGERRAGKQPSELLTAYLQANRVEDPRVEALFGVLFEEVTGAA